MPFFTTEITAIDAFTGELTTFEGPFIEAISLSHAIQYTYTHLPYCRVRGILKETEDLDDRGRPIPGTTVIYHADN